MSVDDAPAEVGAAAVPARSVLPAACYVLAATTVLIQVAAGLPIPPLLAFGILFVGTGVAAQVRLAARWPVVVALVLAALLLLANVPFLISDLAHPESIFGFAPTLLIGLAALVVLALAALALARSATSARPVLLGAAGLAVLGLAGSAVATAGLDDDERQPDDVVVVAEDAEFPDRVEVDAGGAGLYVENDDPFRHTIVVDEAGVSRELPGSTGRRVEVELDPGEYRYYCDVPGHEDMEGTLVVG